MARYCNVVVSLPIELVNELGDALAVPPTPDTAYDQLKAAILRRTTDSESSRLRQLLSAEELGDRCPSQLLHRMHQLLGDRPPEGHNNLLRDLFIQHLPTNVQIILASAGAVTLDTLADIADEIDEYAVPTI